MTINYVMRYAESLKIKNDIANFNEIFTSVDDISAISWELPGYSRREHGGELLNDVYNIVTNGSNDINIMVQLVPEQPDTAVVNYKKTWGLIGGSGINIEHIADKNSFIDHNSKGLILTGVGVIPRSYGDVIQELINSEEKLFFSNLAPNLNVYDNLQADRITQWINDIFINNGIVMFLLGAFDEKDSEVVALGNRDVLREFM